MLVARYQKPQRWHHTASINISDTKSTYLSVQPIGVLVTKLLKVWSSVNALFIGRFIQNYTHPILCVRSTFPPFYEKDAFNS